MSGLPHSNTQSDAEGTSERNELRTLISNRLGNWGEHERDGDYYLNPESESELISKAVREAAVLIGVVDRPSGLQMLLTERSPNLGTHSGQVAFPGGRIDAEDRDSVATALREANEEIGLDPGHVEIVGALPNYYSGSGFRISPIIGLIDEDIQLTANPAEVDEIFEVPFSHMMNLDNYQLSSRFWDGKERHYYSMDYNGHRIWGVTAGIIRVLHNRLYG